MRVDKLLLEYNGKTFLEHSIHLLTDLPVYERIVVTTDIRRKQINHPHTIKLCINQHPEHGQSTSIKLGVEAATGTHYLFLVADQPLLIKDDILPLLNTADSNPEKIIFPIIDSEPNSPTIFPGSFKEDLIKLCGDNGGRVIRDENKELWHTVNPDKPGNFSDIDSAENYARLSGGRFS